MLYQNYNSIERLSDNELVSELTRKKIRKWVLIVHAVVIVLPALGYFVMELFEDTKPKQKFMTIQTVSLPPAPQQTTPKPAAKAPEPVIKKPKPVVKPAPKKATPKPPVKKVPKKAVKKAPKKVNKPKKKSTWKPLKPEDLLKNAKITPAKPTPKPKPKIDTKKLLDKLKRSKVAPVTASSPSRNTTSRQEQSFYESVGTILYDRWNPPSAAQLGGRRPKGRVSITINSFGRILNWKLVSSSRDRSVDLTITELMNSIKQLPAPPSGIRTFNVNLQVD